MTWRDVAIGDVVEKKVFQGPPKGKGDFYYIDISSIDNEKKRIIEPKKIPISQAPSRAKQHVKAGDILVSMTRPNLNAVAIVPEELDGAIASTGFDVLRPIGIDSSLIFRRLTSSEFINEVTSKVQGALYPAIRSSDIRQHRLKIPDPENEKQVIQKIDSLFSEIEKGTNELNKAIELLTTYNQSILNSAIRGKLVPQEPKDEPASKLLERIQKEKQKLIVERREKKEQPLALINEVETPFEIPSSWVWVQLGDVVTLKNGFAFKSDYYSKKQTNYILTTPGHFYEEGGFRDQKAKTKFYSGPIPEGFVLDSGDLIVAMTEQAAGLLGSAAFIPDDGFKYLHNQRLAKISPIGSVLDKKYIYLYFNSPYLRDRLASTCTGSTVRHTSPDRILNNLFPVPPLNEQHRIVRMVERMLTQTKILNAVIRENSSKVKQLKQSILKKAFEGNL